MSEKTTNNHKTEVKQLEVGVNIILVTALIVFAFVLIFYFSHFNGPLDDQEKFGQFGDFVGGILNPFISFCAIVLLVRSLIIQQKALAATQSELQLSREEMAKSSKALDDAQSAHHENVRLQKREILRHQVQDDFEYHWNRYETLISKGIVEATTFNFGAAPQGIKTEIVNYSLDDLLNERADEKLASSFITSIPERMADPKQTDIATQTLIEIANELGYITSSTQELLKLIDSHIVARSIHSRVSEIIYQSHDLNLLDNEIYQTLIEQVEIPARLMPENKLF
jgi:hypothetical protein